MTKSNSKNQDSKKQSRDSGKSGSSSKESSSSKKMEGLVGPNDRPGTERPTPSFPGQGDDPVEGPMGDDTDINVPQQHPGQIR